MVPSLKKYNVASLSHMHGSQREWLMLGMGNARTCMIYQRAVYNVLESYYMHDAVCTQCCVPADRQLPHGTCICRLKLEALIQ